MVRHIVAIAIAVFALLSTSLGSASAHANLLSANIKNNQVLRFGHTPKAIKATFAEELDPKKSWMAVFEGVADHGLVTEKQHSVVDFNHPKHMSLTLPKLAKDKYYLIWYTHSTTDNHYAAGILYFSVK